VSFLQSKSYDAEGIDLSELSIQRAKSLFPKANTKLADAQKLEAYEEGLFDTITLKDCFHHLVGEGDVRKAFEHFRRILKSHGRIVILDPNPNPVLRLARKIVFHLDPEAGPDLANELLAKEGFSVQGLSYYETIGLALSGGYVGLRLVPNFAPLNNAVAAANARLSSFVNRIGWGKSICWRYLIHADRV
jgi:SAM-dependent methyltransferase